MSLFSDIGNALGSVANTVAGAVESGVNAASSAAQNVANQVADTLVNLGLNSPEAVASAAQKNFAKIVQTIKPLTDRLPEVHWQGKTYRLSDALVAGGAGSITAVRATIFWYAVAVMTAPDAIARTIGIQHYDAPSEDLDGFSCDRCEGREESYAVTGADDAAAGISAGAILAAITALAPVISQLINWGHAATNGASPGNSPGVSSSSSGISAVGSSQPGTVDLSSSVSGGASSSSGDSDDSLGKVLVPAGLVLGLLLLLRS